MNKSDFHYRDNGTIITLIPLNAKAKDWIKSNLQIEIWQDVECLPIDHRMFYPILDEIITEGFITEKI